MITITLTVFQDPILTASLGALAGIASFRALKWVLDIWPG